MIGYIYQMKSFMEEIKTGFKTPIKLNQTQLDYCKRAVGAERFCYNWFVGRLYEELDKIDPEQDNGFIQAVKTCNYQKLRKELTALQNTADEFSWLKEIGSRVPVGASERFSVAMRKWKENRFKFGKPKFHKKLSNGAGSFLANGSKSSLVVIDDRHLKITIMGVIKLQARLREGFKPSGRVRISKDGGRWFLSLTAIAPAPKQANSQEVVGVDVGLNPLAVVSDGTIYEKFDEIERLEKKLNGLKREADGVLSEKDQTIRLKKIRQINAYKNQASEKKGKKKTTHKYTAKDFFKKHINRKQTKKTIGSHRHKKLLATIGKLQRRINNLKAEYKHQVSNAIASIEKAGVIVIEDLKVKNLMKNKCLSADFQRAGLGDLLAKIAYKAENRGIELIQANQFFASSKLCHKCGSHNAELKQGMKSWKCQSCKIGHDRDLNAAMNLKQYGEMLEKLVDRDKSFDYKQYTEVLREKYAG